MTEQQNLSDKNNYKIYIQLKKNRKLKQKAKYLTPDFSFSENENEAINFKNLTDAEYFLNFEMNKNNFKIKPRIIIKYVGE